MAEEEEETTTLVAENAAINAALTMDWPPTDFDVDKIAEVAGAAAAGAACASVGAGPASVLCARIGGAVTGWVVNKVGPFLRNVFGRRNRAAARRYAEAKARSAGWATAFQEAQSLASDQGRAVVDMVAELEALNVQLFGRPSGADYMDWVDALRFVGAPFVWDGTYLNGRQSWILFSPVTWYQMHPTATLAEIAATVAGMRQLVDRNVLDTGRAATVLAAKMVGDSAAAAALFAQRDIRTLSTQTDFFAEQTSVALELGAPKEEPSVAPLVVGGVLVSAVGLGAYGWYAGWWKKLAA